MSAREQNECAQANDEPEVVIEAESAESDPAEEQVPPTVDADEAEEQLPPWPPTDWVDPFEVPKNYFMRLSNCCPNHITAMVPDNEEAKQAVDALGKHPPVLFFSHSPEQTHFSDEGEWKDDEWVIYPAKDLPGLCKGIYIHRETMDMLKGITALPSTADIGLIFHPVPHPVDRDIYVVPEIYVMCGGTIRDQLVGDKPCLQCGKNAVMGCSCQTAVFCSLGCKDMARMTGTHSKLDCRAMLREVIASDATRARERIIAAHDRMDADAALEKEDAEAKEKKAKEDSTFDQRKKRDLQRESAMGRRADGLPPSKHLPPIDDNGIFADEPGYTPPKETDAPPEEQPGPKV